MDIVDFGAWRASGTLAACLACATGNSGPEGVAGRVYSGGRYIERVPRDGWQLVVESESYLGEDLVTLEAILYLYHLTDINGHASSTLDWLCALYNEWGSLHGFAELGSADDELLSDSYSPLQKRFLSEFITDWELVELQRRDDKAAKNAAEAKGVEARCLREGGDGMTTKDLDVLRHAHCILSGYYANTAAYDAAVEGGDAFPDICREQIGLILYWETKLRHSSLCRS
tara:strand:+ start:2728 stop:3414 length:687 start_codon:yes stop_codon:yes gene_type:complete